VIEDGEQAVCRFEGFHEFRTELLDEEGVLVRWETKVSSLRGPHMPSIHTESITYDGPGGRFSGTVSWDVATDGPRPGVLVSHAYGGQGEFDTNKAEELARLGYVGLALDMYGEGVRANDADEAARLMNVLVEDRVLLSQRINRALEVLREQPLVNPSQTAAIGFCFGGRCVLDLVRSGADVLGVASFHGIYDAPQNPSSDPIAASVLILHGWDDPLATPEAVVTLGNELTDRQADWQILAFGDTNHAFTNPAAQDSDGGMMYNERSTNRAWRAMTDFFHDLFEA